jgi:hypothetical protein
MSSTTDPVTMPDQPPLPPPPAGGGVDADIDDELDDEWNTSSDAKGFRVRVPIALLLLAFVALGGIWGGAKLQARNAPTDVATRGGAAAAGGQFAGAQTGGTGQANGAGGQRGQGGGGGAAGGAGATIGTVQSVDGNKVTLATQNGQTVTVTLDDKTTISKTDTGATSDIANGQTLVIRGTTNADGTTSAQSVSIGAAGGLGAGGFGGGGRQGGGGGGGQSSAGQGAPTGN